MNSPLRHVSATLAMAAIGLGYVLVQGQAWRPAHRAPARAEATVRPTALPSAPPTARHILERVAALSLTADQKRRLEALDEQWKEESAVLEAALREAEEEFLRFTRQVQAGGKASFQAIQRQSAEFSDRSAALRERRRSHADAAARLLTEAQRRRLAQATPPQTPGGDR